MNGKKGFTLVELCVVMGIVAIIGTMIVTFVVWTSQQNAKSQNSNSIVSELASFQSNVENWISKYDSSDYIITVEEEKITFTDKQERIVEALTYNDKKLTNKQGKAICSVKSFQTVKFEAIKDDGKTVLVKCEIVFRNKNINQNEIQILYFTVHNNIVRERFVSPDRPRTEDE